MSGRILSLIAVLALGGPAAGASEGFPYILESKIPTFGVEGPLKLEVKVFDRSKKEIRDATVIFEISPAVGPPPYGHVKEMAYSKQLMEGDTSDPGAKEYLSFLKNLKTAAARNVRRVAVYDRSTGYYTANHMISKFPWAIAVYVAEPGGPLLKAPFIFPHRSHCEYGDVINVELVKTTLHQVAALAKNGKWAEAGQKMGVIHASVHGMHGTHFTIVLHHGEAPRGVEDEVKRLQKSVEQKSRRAVIGSVGRALGALEKTSERFITVNVEKTEGGKPSSQDGSDNYDVLVRDIVNEKGITGAIVIVDENYKPEANLTDPSVVPMGPPDRGMYRSLYHAKLAHLPQGIVAREVGEGRYRFKSKDFGSTKGPKRVFVYYAFNSPGLPQDKFVTKEFNLPYDAQTSPKAADTSGTVLGMQQLR